MEPVEGRHSGSFLAAIVTVSDFWSSDFRAALRTARTNPGFTCSAILALAVGIGGSTAIFSVVDAIVLRPLPLPDSGRLVSILGTHRDGSPTKLAPANYLDVAEQATAAFAGIAAYYPRLSSLVTPAGAEMIPLGAVTSGFFATAGVRPAIGRDFSGEEDQFGRDTEIILSDSFWRTRFGGSHSVLGRTARLNDRAYTVIGVLPPHFAFPGLEHVDGFVPIGFTAGDLRNRRSEYLSAIGRLRPDVSIERARAIVDTVARGLIERDPSYLAGTGGTAVSLQADFVAPARPVLGVILASAFVVMLIACANVAGLQLLRGASRQRELAIRAALGASRARIVRQLFTESVLLALVAAALGLLAARWLVDAIVAIAPSDTPRIEDAALDGRALLVTIPLSFLSAMLSGLWPALRTSRLDLADSLKDGSPHSGDSSQRLRARRMLVTGEIALAVVLVTGAALLIRSFEKVWTVPRGFDAGGILTAQVRVPAERWRTTRQFAEFYAELVRRVKALPAVKNASATTLMPLEELGGWNNYFEIEGKAPPSSGQLLKAELTWTTPDFLSVLRIPLLAGRFFEERDGAGAERVVVVNEEFARQYFAGEDPVGRQLRMISEGGLFSQLGEGPELWRYRIVGVIANSRMYGLARAIRPEIYISALQQCFSRMNLLVRTDAADPVALAGDLRRTLAQLDPTVPLTRVRTYDQVLAASAGERLFPLVLLTSFGAVALLLATLGIYAVIAWTVAQRTREYGIRMALGAQRNDILRLVGLQGLSLAVPGVAIGLLASALAAPAMRALLFGIGALDGFSYVLVAFVLFGAAMCAALLPGLRATRIEPGVALKA